MCVFGHARGRDTLIEIPVFPSQADYARNVFRYRLLFPLIYPLGSSLYCPPHLPPTRSVHSQRGGLG